MGCEILAIALSVEGLFAGESVISVNPKFFIFAKALAKPSVVAIKSSYLTDAPDISDRLGRPGTFSTLLSSVLSSASLARPDLHWS